MNRITPEKFQTLRETLQAHAHGGRLGFSTDDQTALADEMVAGGLLEKREGRYFATSIGCFAYFEFVAKAPSRS